MAKNKGRKFRKYLRGNINHGFDLATLAGSTAAGSTISDTVTEKAWVSSVLARWSIHDWTPAVNEGPIVCGLAHSDYSTAEIEQWFENTGSWEAHDLVQQEIAKRKIRLVGIFQNPAAVGESSVLNNGLPVRTKCGWMLGTGQTLRPWVYNVGTAALATTGPQLEVAGHANLWPA